MKRIPKPKPNPLSPDFVKEIKEGVYQVKSFRELDKVYTVDLQFNTCDCVAYQMGRTVPCKHIKLVSRETCSEK